MLSLPVAIDEAPDALPPRERRCDGCGPGEIPPPTIRSWELRTQFDLTRERIRQIGGRAMGN
ncbi:hypothetical protein OKW37_000018 [Paraburkholderia sp. MM5482-R2]